MIGGLGIDFLESGDGIDYFDCRDGTDLVLDSAQLIRFVLPFSMLNYSISERYAKAGNLVDDEDTSNSDDTWKGGGRQWNRIRTSSFDGRQRSMLNTYSKL